MEVRGFEPLTPCVQGRCSPAELHPLVLRVFLETKNQISKKLFSNFDV